LLYTLGKPHTRSEETQWGSKKKRSSQDCRFLKRVSEKERVRRRIRTKKKKKKELSAMGRPDYFEAGTGLNSEGRSGR